MWTKVLAVMASSSRVWIYVVAAQTCSTLHMIYTELSVGVVQVQFGRKLNAECSTHRIEKYAGEKGLKCNWAMSTPN